MRFRRGVVILACGATSLAACFGEGARLLDPEDGGVADPVDFGDAGTDVGVFDVDLGDPFAVQGLSPSHGPWSGGTRTVLRGRGFSSTLAITVGGKPVDPSAIVASDPTRVSFITPAGTPGPADVTLVDTSSAQERTLPGGFFYDAFAVKPESGAASGGTRVRLEGSGTQFAAGTTVSFGQSPCTDLEVTSATEIECTTPGGPLGPVEVTVKVPGQGDLLARDAFLYTDVFDPARGGLSGGVLTGTLRVDVHDGATGLPIPGAKVVLGESIASGIVGTTGVSGSVTFDNPSIAPKVTVTATAKCHQPQTIVDVPVDTARFYLAPVIDCANLDDPPSTGGGGFRNGGVVSGELVWPGIEFKRVGWTNVPNPVRPSERQAAYVFLSSNSPDNPFTLPGPAQATTNASPGGQGYAYSIVVPPGNATVYALAGIEDLTTSPPRFTVFAMGVARGVAVSPSQQVSSIDIPMSSIVDHAMSISSQPPPVTPRGPDRLFANLAVSIGPSAYALLPNGAQQKLLPFLGNVTFNPLPSLDGALAGEAYVVGAKAATTAAQDAPASVVSRVRVTNPNAPVTLGGFLPVPTLVEPAAAAFGGTHVEFGAQGTYDLARITIDSGGGKTSWTIVVPPGKTSFGVPDLATLPDDVGLAHGPIQTTVHVARLPVDFSFDKLRSGDLAPTRWSAYAWDTLSGSY